MKQLFKTGLVCCMSLLSVAAFGQSTQTTGKEPKTYLDLMVNMSSSTMNYGASNGQFSDYKKSINGIQAGVSFQAGITGSFSLVPELYYMRKGGKLISGNPLHNSEATLRLNTFEMPVLARVHIGQVYLNAGPSIAYTFSGSYEVNKLSTKLNFVHSADGFTRMDAGMQIGGGIEMPFKNRRIALDIRYNHGLVNISRSQEMYNRGIMVSIHISKAWKHNPLANTNR